MRGSTPTPAGHAALLLLLALTGTAAAQPEPPPPPPIPRAATTPQLPPPETLPPPAAPPAATPTAPPPAPQEPPAAGDVKRDDIRKLVEEEVKKRLDEQKKQDEEAKKRKDEEEKQKKEAEGYVVGSSLNLQPVWQDGLFFISANKDFIFHLQGTMHLDGAWYDAAGRIQDAPGGIGDIRDGVNLRRMRLRADATIWEVIDFRMEVELANGVTAAGARGNNPNPVSLNLPDAVFQTSGPTDAWMTITHLPYVGNVRIGFQKEPFSLEALNDHRFLEFMERSFLFDSSMPSAFNNGRSPGISAFNTAFDDRLFWGIGAFKNINNFSGFGVGDGQYAVTGRLAGSPLYEDDGRYVLHLGTGYSYRDPIAGLVNIRVREAVRNAPFPLLNSLANTGAFGASTQELLNLEAAAVMGPLTFQAQYIANVVRGATTAAGQPVGAVYFPGFYAEVLWFLTGEVRPYNRKLARFERVRPNEPFFWVPGRSSCSCFGKGAWELGVRYEEIDLTDKGINGGYLRGVTLGLNWYLNPNVKIQWNYDVTHRSDTGTNSDGTIQAFGTRLAFDF
jgi:phosphate-selective porin OprO/OprP